MNDQLFSRTAWSLTRALIGATALLGQVAFAGESPAGIYRINDGPDVASELILLPNGKFEYFLAAGSLDEQAKGTWQVEGSSLRLRTLPKPVPAVFSRGPISSVPGTSLALHVTNPAGRGLNSVHFILGFATGQPIRGYTQDYGWTMDGRDKRIPRWVELSVPIYNLQSPRFQIDVAKGNKLVFVLTPNDLGTFDFTGMQIDIQPNRLIMHRGGALIAFEARSKGQ